MENRINRTVSVRELFNQQLLTLQKTGEDEKPPEYQPVSVAEVRQAFAHIPLTDEEEAMALLNAYKLKAEKLKVQEDERRRRERKEAIRRMWTADECFEYAYSCGKAIGEQRGFDFVLDENNEAVFNLLTLYFSNDPRFEQQAYFGKPYSLKKGICLLSPIRGNGKTTLLDCFMYNKKGCFAKWSTKQLVKMYEKGGLEAIERFMWLLPIVPSPMHFYQERAGIHYDDFGDEPEVMHMGNRRLVSNMIINSIYDDHPNERCFHMFHISMNYKWSEFEQRFGSNAASRMEEMFNLIPLPGESRRK